MVETIYDENKAERYLIGEEDKIGCQTPPTAMTIGSTKHVSRPATVDPDVKHVGLGGAPNRATTFPSTAQERKQHPVASGFLDYFPDAIVAVAKVSWLGNEQHNPGQPVHWARGKSGDHMDALMRHALERGKLDSDGLRHSAKMAWRALALLQEEIEQESK